MYPNFSFKITAENDGARVGCLSTPHGVIDTPNYVFCGTKGSVKTLKPADVKAAGAQIILANAYHMMVSPGEELVERQGGLHKFMRWDAPMMTDSGGFQVFSMGHGGVSDEVKGRARGGVKKSLLDISEEGAAFRSYKDGRKILLTPERSMDIQRKLGADIIMQFDECPAYNDSRYYTARSMELSMRWGERSLSQFNRHNDGSQALYGIVQGGVYEDLRKTSSSWTAARPFFGTAIGGCLGGSDEEMRRVVASTIPYIEKSRPVHFLGIGRVQDIFTFVRYGIDTFDCVIPTRLARHGIMIKKGEGNLNLKNARFRDDERELGLGMEFTYSYVHHLIKSGELLGMQILTEYNIASISKLMGEVRAAIKDNTLNALEAKWLD